MHPGPAPPAGPEGSISQYRAPLGQTMSESADFTQLDDPAFLVERARLRERLEHVPESARDRAGLERLYEAMTEEFLSRARIAWTSAPATPESRRHGHLRHPRSEPKSWQSSCVRSRGVGVDSALLPAALERPGLPRGRGEPGPGDQRLRDREAAHIQAYLCDQCCGGRPARAGISLSRSATGSAAAPRARPPPAR
jgi:hypothetical protein